jgi:hypothetical protein
MEGIHKIMEGIPKKRGRYSEKRGRYSQKSWKVFRGVGEKWKQLKSPFTSSHLNKPMCVWSSPVAGLPDARGG